LIFPFQDTFPRNETIYHPLHDTSPCALIRLVADCNLNSVIIIRSPSVHLFQHQGIQHSLSQ